MRKIFAAMACSVFVVWAFSPYASAGENGRVLIVHSYHKESEWVVTMSAATDRILKPAGITYEYLYMDTFRRNSLEQMKEAGQRAREKVAEFKPSVILTFDDNAQLYFAKDYAGKDSPQIVFGGVNAAPAQYGYPAKNVTGILERLYIEQQFDFLKKLKPDAGGVGFVSDDSSTTDGIYASIQNTEYPGLKMKYARAATFAGWRDAVRRYDRDPEIDAICIVVNKSVRKDTGEGRVDPPVISEWTVNNTKKVIFGFWESKVIEGAVFSIAVSGDEHGAYPASLAKEIIMRGKRAGEFPIIKNRDGKVCLNLKTAEKLGVEIPFTVIDTADVVIQ